MLARLAIADGENSDLAKYLDSIDDVIIVNELCTVHDVNLNKETNWAMCNNCPSHGKIKSLKDTSFLF